jgi:hypothetical protein|tara:strand:- start:822 stop:1034 length:213 start_codon:yes stop_codon:yes gene_type:complete
MNKNLNELAEVVLEHGQFKFTKLGDYVECSISNQKIPIEELKYWNVDLQEVYASPDIAMKRYKELNDIKD